MGDLFVVRGLPKSGKTTLARQLAPDANFAADDYFTDPKTGKYRYDPSQVGRAHAECQNKVREALFQGVNPVAVHNTFSQYHEARPYFEMAKKCGYRVTVIECQNRFEDNGHNVPEEVFERMKMRWSPLVPFGEDERRKLLDIIRNMAKQVGQLGDNAVDILERLEEYEKIETEETRDEAKLATALDQAELMLSSIEETKTFSVLMTNALNAKQAIRDAKKAIGA